MSEHTIILQGTIKNFIKSYSGNLSFTLEDSQKNLHYCFSTKKRPILSLSDSIIVIGSTTTANKVRINYLINQTKNTEENMLEASSDWIYYTSLISAILCTIGLIVGILVVVFITPTSFGPFWGFLGSFFSMMILMILIFTLVPAMIIFWVLTSSFSKKRKSTVQLSEDISRIKENLSGSIKPTIKSAEVMGEPASGQKEKELFTPRAQFCANCGTKVAFEAKFCPSCGSEQ